MIVCLNCQNNMIEIIPFSDKEVYNSRFISKTRYVCNSCDSVLNFYKAMPISPIHERTALYGCLGSPQDEKTSLWNNKSL
jgi:transposase-like protein